MPDDDGVDEHERELDDPEDEEGQQVRGRDSRAGRERVGDPLPRGAEDRAQRHRRDPPAVVRLRREVDDGHRGAHDDEEPRPRDARGRPHVHREPDVVAGCAARVEDHDGAEDR